jgi:hypothetical protein
MKFARCLVLLAAVAAPGTAWGQISLSITTTVDSARLPDLAVTVDVSNGGKEAAHSLRPTVQAGAGRVTLPALQDLRPGQTHKFSASIPLPAASKPGTYPVFVTIAYADANGYSFSAIASSSYSSGAATTSDIFGVLTAMPVSDKGELRLKLKNNSSEARALTITPVLPLELTPDGLPRTLTLAPGQENELKGAIANFSALGGSRYPIFFAVEYEAGDRHFSNVITTLVDVVAPGTVFSRYLYWIIGAGLVLLLAAIRQMTRRRKPRRPRSEPARVGDSRP